MSFGVKKNYFNGFSSRRFHKKKNIEHNTQGHSTGTIIGRIAQSQKRPHFKRSKVCTNSIRSIFTCNDNKIYKETKFI